MPRCEPACVGTHVVADLADLKRLAVALADLTIDDVEQERRPPDLAWELARAILNRTACVPLGENAELYYAERWEQMRHGAIGRLKPHHALGRTLAL